METKDQRTKYDEILNAKDANWRAEARVLMEKKKQFVVVGWDYSQDSRDSTALAQELDYKFAFDHKKERAFFKPRDCNLNASK
jgi:hypothetical protein